MTPFLSAGGADGGCGECLNPFINPFIKILKIAPKYLRSHASRRKGCVFAATVLDFSILRDKPDRQALSVLYRTRPAAFLSVSRRVEFWSIGSRPLHWQAAKSASFPPCRTTCGSCREDEFGSHAARRPSLWSLILHRLYTNAVQSILDVVKQRDKLEPSVGR